MRAWLLPLAFALLPGCAAESAPQPSARGGPAVPRRIVSINPCLDAILIEVADPEQIAGISRYSHDPRATSVGIERARRYGSIDDTAEAVLAADPDLVLAGALVSGPTIAALKRLGIPIVQLPVAETVAESEAQVAAVARSVGRPERGAELNHRIDAALAATRWTGKPVPALIWQGSGLVPGKGTLADELLTHTGFANVSRHLGLEQWDIVPIEDMLAHPPEVLFAGEANMGAGNADGNRMLAHPVLRKVASRIRFAEYSSSLLHCGGPVIVRSVQRLAEVRRQQERGS